MKAKNLARLGVLASALAVLAVLAPLAQAREPAPGYTQFAGCPSPDENPIISSCQHSVVTGGFVQMGSKKVPIEKPISLTGGTDENLGNFSYNSKGGLAKVPQKVPGGIVGLTGLSWLTEFLGIEALDLYAVTELAGTPELKNINNFTLKVKVHLVNPALGKNCYIGSEANPIVWHLTTGTTSPPPPNEPITGKNPKITFSESPEILFAKDGLYVDNSFSAPGASGCTLTVLGLLPISLNGLVNANSGLPAAAGTNTTEQIIDSEVAASEVVYP